MRKATRHFLLWYGLLETFVFTGNILGWSALHYMLRNQGIYSSLCQSDDVAAPLQAANSSIWYIGNMSMADTENLFGFNEVEITSNVPYPTCERQDTMLNLAYTIGSFCMGSTSFIWGFLLEKWGLRNVRLIINGLITSGTILLSITVKETSFLLFPSLILMCLAGVPLRLANMQIADLFPEKRSTIITLYSGAFSASASVFMFLKHGFDAGLPWSWSCFLLVALSALMLPVTLFLLPADKIQEEKGGLFAVGDKELSTVAPCVWGTFTYILDDMPFQKCLGHKDKPDSYSTINEKVKEPEPNPLKKSFLSLSYHFHQYWFCWLILYTIIYVGTLHLWVKRANAEDHESFITELYGLLQVSGLFLGPIGGLYMDWSIRRVLKKDAHPKKKMLRVIRSCFWPMFLTTSLQAATHACKFFNTTIAIYISIVAVSLLRAFFLSIGTAYLRLRFPAEHFNKLLGIMSTFSSIASLFQFPLFLWESSSPVQAFYVNIFETILLAIAYLHPLLLVVTPVQKFLLGKITEDEKTDDGKS